MERKEIERELFAAGAQELLESSSAAHLAYIGTDGTPRVIPVGFWWTGEQARIAITPTWVRFYDFGAGRMPRFLQELAERNLS
jgi:nitroimidazol reductase NimA-like FMN-containing flavoprotein (pyridoxamine 5'-phosphate oxidase superfamily)